MLSLIPIIHKGVLFSFNEFQNEDNMDPPMFFGFVGLFSTLLLWPGLFILHSTEQEPFQLPTAKQWEFLVVNGVIGTVLSELLWLLGCFYTSSLIATLSIGLTIPLSIIADIVWKQKSYHAIFVVGAIPMFISFFIIALLTHYQDWDPLLDFCKFFGNQCKILLCCKSNTNRSRYQRTRERLNSGYVFDQNERESLIEQINCDNDNNELVQPDYIPSANQDNTINIDRAGTSISSNKDTSPNNSRTSDISESEPM